VRAVASVPRKRTDKVEDADNELILGFDSFDLMSEFSQFVEGLRVPPPPREAQAAKH